MKKIAIYGGTFNPIHNGHIIAAHSLVDSGLFDEVHIMPSALPPFKEETASIGLHRLNMVRLVFSHVKGIEVNDIEYSSQEMSYTYHTLKKLKNSHRENLYYWVIGYDNLPIIEQWKDSHKLLREFGIAVINRGGYEVEEANKLISSIVKKYHTDILRVSMPNVELSSTNIRLRISEGKSLLGYIPDSLIDYINRENLYRE